MTYVVRPIEPDEVPTFRERLQNVFFGSPDPETDEENLDRMRRYLEVERTRCAFDGSEMVATLGTLSLSMTIPGGTQHPIAGTTMVTVSPTHRRRGILRMMMESHFAEIREKGEFGAALFASDSAIYGRFGYGLASMWAETTVERNHVAPHPSVTNPASVDQVARDAFEQMAPDIYEAAVPERPGMFIRTEEFWIRRLDDRTSARNGASSLRFAKASEGGYPTGYAIYRIKPGEWTDHHGDSEISVIEVIAHTPASTVGLWRFLLEHDLVSKIKLEMRPEDDPVFSLLAGFRRAGPRLSDQLFFRILDVPKALEARAYPNDGSLMLRVGETGGEATTYRLDIDGGRAVCSPDAGEADIELGIEDLGGIYLGRSRLRQLAGVGRVRGSDERLTKADNLFEWHVAPWCQEIF